MPTLTSDLRQCMADKLTLLYGAEMGSATLERLVRLIADQPIAPRFNPLSERDMILIAYADHVQNPGLTPLATLHRFLKSYLADLINTVHLLPFYPYSSDDGFSVIDYRTVDAKFGTWADVERLRADFRLMFDLVLNHASTESAWFQAFCRNEMPYRDYFLTAEPSADLSRVTRPRTHPLLTPVETSAGMRHIWTTFSADQVDLNFSNPAVLLEMIDVLLFYVRQGADLIRLDAIAYLWKTIDTTCIHLPQTHGVVQLLRDVLDVVAPWVRLVTETNVPHMENLSYFGNGENEAQMVYQFALPPLIIDAFYTHDARILSAWANTLQTSSPSTTFFNFTASHDGIGVRPAVGLLTDGAIQAMLTTVEARGGYISYKTNADGTQSAYEMNITYFDALAVPGELLTRSIDRFIVSQAIMLSLAGVPGIYLPSLLGATNDYDGVRQTGRVRSINREKLNLAALEGKLADGASRQAQVFRRFTDLLRIRRSQVAFHPNGSQRILDLHPAVFAVERTSPDGTTHILALHNVTDQSITVQLPSGQWGNLGNQPGNHQQFHDQITLDPYWVAWLVAR